MDAFENPPAPEAPETTGAGASAPAHRPATSWVDLLLYLLAGPGVFFGLGLAASRYAGLKPSLLTSALSFTLNVVIFVGAVALVGFARGRLSPAGIGLFPPRWRWAWLVIALGIVVVMAPVRGAISLAVELLLHGDLTGLTEGMRAEMLVPKSFRWDSFAVSLILGGMLVPAAEELFFRGALYTWFRERTGVVWATLASSLIFALAHFDTFVVMISAFILGAINALAFERTRSIWAAIAIHALNNSLAFGLLYAVLAVQHAFPQLVP